MYASDAQYEAAYRAAQEAGRSTAGTRVFHGDPRASGAGADEWDMASDSVFFARDAATAMAVADERERCAKIVEAHCGPCGWCNATEDAPAICARELVEKIRNGDHA